MAAAWLVGIIGGKQRIKGFVFVKCFAGGEHWQPRPFSILWLSVMARLFMIEGFTERYNANLFSLTIYAHEHEKPGTSSRHRISHKANIA